MSEPTFRAWPKTPRLFKDCVISEKIDGTNGAVHVMDDGRVYCQSRTRLLPMGPQGMDDVDWAKRDNHGFAAWVREHSHLLSVILGPGTHYGEWWGNGINRGYDCKPGDKRFSLFNTSKWAHLRDHPSYPELPSLSVVPVLWTGPFDTERVLDIADYLQRHGSVAKPGYDRPEGLCIYHTASNSVFKYPFDKNEGREAKPAEEPISVDALVKQILGLAA